MTEDVATTRRRKQRNAEALAVKAREAPATIDTHDIRQAAIYIGEGVLTVPDDAPGWLQVLALNPELKLWRAGLVTMTPLGLGLHDTDTGCAVLLDYVEGDDGKPSLVPSTLVAGDLPSKYEGDLLGWFGAR